MQVLVDLVVSTSEVCVGVACAFEFDDADG